MPLFFDSSSIRFRRSFFLAAASLWLGVVGLSSEAIGDDSTVAIAATETISRPQPPPSGEFGFDSMISRGFKPLFNGQNLDGWRNPYPHGSATVEDGEIHLLADDKFFLVTKRKYSNFRLSAEIHLPDGPANSGIMFRCHVDQTAKKIVYGYQAECDGSDRRWSGGLYDESRRGWLFPSTPGRSQPQFLLHEESSKAHFAKPNVRDALRRNDWNRFVITAIDDRIEIELNGVKTVSMRDTMDAEGFIGIQHHGEDGQVYRFRNLFIKELPAIPAESTVSLTTQPPVSIKKINDKVILVDFGKVAFGNLEMRMPQTGRGYANVHFGERLVDGRIDRDPPGTVRYASTKLRLSSGELGNVIVSPPSEVRNTEQTGTSGSHPPAVLTPRRWLPVIPFRWVEIEGWPGDFQPDFIHRRAAFATAWDDDASDFRCSDPMLNEIYDLCKYSIKATTFAGVYVDGDRERIPYEADAYLNQLSHYATDNDVTMAARTFDWLMAHGTWPTEWAPHMVMMAHAHWMHTGDVDWLAARYESLKTKTLMNRVGASGNESGGKESGGFVSGGLVLSDELDQRKHDIVDWPKGERDGFVFTPVNTVVNAFHLEAAGRMAEMAQAIGKSDEAADWRKHRALTLAKLHQRLFDQERGIFVDGDQTDHASAHANLFPLAFGLVPNDRTSSVIDWLKKRGMPCSVYAAQYLLDGLFQNGAGDHALELITASNDRSWQHMLDSGTTITWEAWDLKYKSNQDWNHAWGAAPANLLPRHVLGVQVAQPGWKTAIIRPTLGKLTSASGKVPTPKGPIDVQWKRETGDAPSFDLRVQLPTGVVANVECPNVVDDPVVTVDGMKVDFEKRDDRLILSATISDTAQIRVSPR